MPEPDYARPRAGQTGSGQGRNANLATLPTPRNRPERVNFRASRQPCCYRAPTALSLLRSLASDAGLLSPWIRHPVERFPVVRESRRSASGQPAGLLVFLARRLHRQSVPRGNRTSLRRHRHPRPRRTTPNSTGSGYLLRWCPPRCHPRPVKGGSRRAVTVCRATERLFEGQGEVRPTVRLEVAAGPSGQA